MSDLVPERDIDQSHNQILLSSAHYLALFCDLSDSEALAKALSELIPKTYHVLFVAEVSMTYMDVDAADKVIEMAAQFPYGQFCLLEQWMPYGPLHPFASTMIKHFVKLQSPLKAPMEYQNSASQKRRFQTKGWQHILVQSLWSFWSDDKNILPSERTALDQLEQFDEWEDFILFGQHYFILIASSPRPGVSTELEQDQDCIADSRYLKSSFSPYLASEQLHRNSASFRVGKTVFCHGGYGTRGRLKDNFAYSVDRLDTLSERNSQSISSISLPDMELMCHTITRLDKDTLILVGGRTSPSSASNRCFIRDTNNWKNIPDLPEGRYRHCAVSVQIELPDSNTPAILIFGGKSGSEKVLGSWLIWWPATDYWQQLEVVGECMPARFAAAISAAQPAATRGHVFGGIGRNGKMLNDLWQWELIYAESGIKMKCLHDSKRLELLNGSGGSFGRVGASLIEHASALYIVGGVDAAELTSSQGAILRIDANLQIFLSALQPDLPPSLLIGHCLEVVEASGDGLVIAIAGGGANCFSFGTFWNEGSYLTSTAQINLAIRPWTVLSSQMLQSMVHRPPNGGQEYQQDKSGSTSSNPGYNITSRERASASHDSLTDKAIGVPAVMVSTENDFQAIVYRATPTVLRSLDLGRCTAIWDLDYLQRQLGETREVVVHSSPSSQMDFLDKNFGYTKMRFADFVQAVRAGERLYLRSLSSERPTQKATKLEVDFPSISQDFKLPDELKLVADNTHSSPLRISGPVNMWLHFDVMANILCQISGRKRLVLFPPWRVDRLAFPHGVSSSKIHVFDKNGEVRPEVQCLEPWICDLKAGEVLFIPALWPHAAFPVDGISIAVNVFFRSLSGGYAAGKDIYGNRDVQAYENGRRDIERIRKSFTRLPGDFQAFYLTRLAAELVGGSDSSHA